MQFTTLLVAAFAAIAQAVDVQVVSVGQNPMAGMAGQPALKYYPDNIKAAVGSMVQFQFWAGNHTVTQSDFDHPCTPISQVNSSVTGIWSSFMPVAAGASKKEIPVFTVMINDTKPIWIFCSQAKHCSSGMSMVINENTSANSTRSLTNYRTAASTAQGGSGSGSGAPAGSPPSYGSPSPSSGSGSDASAPPAAAPTDAGSPPAAPPASAPTDVVAPPPSVTTGASSPSGTGVLPGGATDTGIPKSAASSVGVSSSLLLALAAAFALL
ncbi:hypothetical protein T069G_05870 [Trichoderma breve]|uniref:Extracellular serine-rich protein n=3 Tax=Trichoderma TaxID=5543 RepID=A0A9W9BEB8_9HYPO|nr:hypothetical protein T069G_05870 [Trichoderma breve]KAF3074614.1 Extracellular serine-rich protein [Trichoderma lentiforme]KAJ4860882.1 hypothetical protein T069G_05870 [Trichoderma breve]OPB43165.1 hypothetical protein A0O28_0088010 [Trichoderma guizhouense]